MAKMQYTHLQTKAMIHDKHFLKMDRVGERLASSGSPFHSLMARLKNERLEISVRERVTSRCSSPVDLVARKDTAVRVTIRDRSSSGALS